MNLTKLQSLDDLRQVEVGTPIVFMYDFGKSKSIPHPIYDPVNPVMPDWVDRIQPIYGTFAGYNPEVVHPLAINEMVELPDTFLLRSNRGDALEAELERIAEHEAEFQRRFVEAKHNGPKLLKITPLPRMPNRFNAERVGGLYVVE